MPKRDNALFLGVKVGESVLWLRKMERTVVARLSVARVKEDEEVCMQWDAAAPVRWYPTRMPEAAAIGGEFWLRLEDEVTALISSEPTRIRVKFVRQTRADLVVWAPSDLRIERERPAVPFPLGVIQTLVQVHTGNGKSVACFAQVLGGAIVVLTEEEYRVFSFQLANSSVPHQRVAARLGAEEALVTLRGTKSPGFVESSLQVAEIWRSANEERGKGQG